MMRCLISGLMPLSQSSSRNDLASYPRSTARLRRSPELRRATCGPIFASCFFEVVEWMSVIYSDPTSTSAVTFSARKR